MVTRRTFIKMGLAGPVLWLAARSGAHAHALAAIRAGTLDPNTVPKFVTRMLIPPVMPRAGKVKVKASPNIDYYEIVVRQFRQQILPAGLPATTVWGYGPNPDAVKGGPMIFNAPSMTIEAKFNRPVRIKWINGLMDADGSFLPHLLPVDPTLHWANPPGGPTGRDTRPAFSGQSPGPYQGPVPIVTHVHGAIGVGDESDGYAEAWYLPAANNIPSGYATEGTWYDFFRTKALARFGEEWGPGFATFQYPNRNRASTIWYHDHSLGMTRLNVYAGPAGFYIIRGGPTDQVLDARNGQPGILPGPAPAHGDPAGLDYHEIPVAIQDRAFNADGSLFYPDSRAFFDEVAGPYIPEEGSDISPIWNPEFFGNTIMVNGNTWPFQTVEQRRYRIRFLNGCNSRFLILDFANIPGVEAWQIGNEGGFLPAPVNLGTANRNRLLMAPAERADVIVDFTNVPVGSYILGNVGPDEPFGGGEPGNDFDAADPATTGQIMQFRVVAAKSRDFSTPPQFLDLPSITSLPAPIRTRPLALLEQMSTVVEDAPVEALLGTVDGDPASGAGMWHRQEWMGGVTENPGVGDTETWEFYNTTADAHPIHIHEIAFEVIDRQAIDIDEQTMSVRVSADSQPMPPAPWERGLKDTVIAYPGQVTRVRGCFDTPGQFVWHCHIVEHEDNEMMRPYRIGPAQTGQPEGAGPHH